MKELNLCETEPGKKPCAGLVWFFCCCGIIWGMSVDSVVGGGSGGVVGGVDDGVLLGLVGEGLSPVGVSERLGGLLSPEEVFVRVRGLLGGGGVWGVSELELVVLGRLLGVVGVLEERLRDGSSGVSGALVRGLEVVLGELRGLRERVEGRGLVLGDGLVRLVVQLVVGVVGGVVERLGVEGERLKSVGGVEGLLGEVLPSVVRELEGVSDLVGGVSVVGVGVVTGEGVVGRVGGGVVGEGESVGGVESSESGVGGV